MAKVFRDDYGIPHIDAVDLVDAVFAIGYAHCEDDFFTIQTGLLAPKCRSGWFEDWDGPYLDFLAEYFEVNKLAEENVPLIDNDYLELCKIYCDAINKYAEENPKEILDKSIFPVTTRDLLATQYLMEIVGIQLDKPYSYIKKGETRFPHKEGSNVVAINSFRTDDGRAIMAMSPHQQMEGLFSFYGIHFYSRKEAMEVYGFIMPCTFTVFMGTNFNVAWGSTANYPDMYSVYKVRTIGRINKKVLLDGLEIPAKNKIYRNHFNLYGKVPVPVVRKYLKTDIGNIIKVGDSYILFDIPSCQRAIGTQLNYKIMRCKTVDELKSCVFAQRFPYLDVVAIDTDNNILYIHDSFEQIRQNQEDHKKDFLDLTSLSQLKREFYDTNNIICVKNPRTGYIVAANQSPLFATDERVDFDKYKGLISKTDNSRSKRLKELLNDKRHHDCESLKEIFCDTKIILPIVRNIDFSELYEMSVDDGTQYLKDILCNWDGTANLDSEGAAVFALLFVFYKQYYTYSKDSDVIVKAQQSELKQCLKKVAKIYRKGMTLRDIQFLHRGNKKIPVAGIPDSISTVRAALTNKELIAEETCAFKLIIDLSLEKVFSCHPFGSSSIPEDKNFTSQMQMYADGSYKSIKRIEYYMNNYESYTI